MVGESNATLLLECGFDNCIWFSESTRDLVNEVTSSEVFGSSESDMATESRLIEETEMTSVASTERGGLIMGG